jgi:inner membrane protein involved in colicin E2 resistance
MDSTQPPVIPRPAPRWRNTVTLKLLFIAALVLLLQLPLGLVNQLRQTRVREQEGNVVPTGLARLETNASPVEGHRMVERALKHSVLILTLVFTAFFLLETLAGLRLHAVHYGLVGAALCLFYLVLLALGEVLAPDKAYIGAAIASSLLITLYCVSILHSYLRASLIAALLVGEYGVLYVILRMENFALLAGTAALFAVLAALMYFTRNVDWFAHEAGREVRA